MAIIFTLLIILGLLQVMMLLRQNKRMQKLRLVELSANESLLSRKKGKSLLWRSVEERLGDMRFHLLGKGKGVLLRNFIIIIGVQFAGVYISQEYIQINLLILLPVLFFVTVYTIYLNAKKKMRIEFETGFSEALNIINSSIRAGNTITQGISECGLKLEGILGAEFKQVSRRLDIGEDVENVFKDSYSRLPYREYYFFIITVLINMKGGGQVKEVMSKLASMISDGRILERKKYAMTSEVRMSVKILAAIPVMFFVFLKYQSPDSFDILVYNPTGQILLYYAIASILFGLLIVWMMMNRV